MRVHVCVCFVCLFVLVYEFVVLTVIVCLCVVFGVFWVCFGLWNFVLCVPMLLFQTLMHTIPYHTYHAYTPCIHMVCYVKKKNLATQFKRICEESEAACMVDE